VHKISSVSLQMLRALILIGVVVMSLWTCGNRSAIAQEQPCEKSSKASPIWSPDGELIAFGWLCDGQSDIWLIEPDGSSLTNLTADVAGFIRGINWSPDGERISFISEQNGEQDLWVIKKDGSDAVNLTQDEAVTSLGNPRWSPDGTTIAFEASENIAGKPGIWTITSDDLGLQQLTPDDDYAYVLPSWSPDSQHLVFAGTKAGISQLWVANRDGLNLTRITPIDFYALNVQWSPVDNRIATASPKDGIWITNSLGTDLVIFLPNNVALRQSGRLMANPLFSRYLLKNSISGT
jgi:Tol biopolymer transport system component